MMTTVQKIVGILLQTPVAELRLRHRWAEYGVCAEDLLLYSTNGSIYREDLSAIAD